ncbi:MAG: helix-turn-helix domain-containing protein [Clostridia bacterium]|nr:helix-turn-helix domain-containing protein [Clostridia bacterium]
MLLNELISDKLEKIRKEKRIGVYTLCNKAAISYETYRSIRKNRNKDIYIRTLLILLRTLDVTPAEFFSDPMFTSEELDIDFK